MWGYHLYMDEAVLTDLKQFITAIVSQQTSQLNQKFDALEHRLDKKIDDLSASVADALHRSNEAIELWRKDHEQRITYLERKTSKL